jgi:hypothetical protein
MKELLIVFALLLSAVWGFSQTGQPENLAETGIRGSFAGSIIYPGFVAGIERPYSIIQRDKIRKKGIKTKYTERYLAYNFGFYYHPTFHTNLFFQVERIRRRQKSSGIYGEYGLGLGWSRTFLSGPAFKVNNDGEVKRAPLAGNFYGLFSVSGAVGYNLNLKHHLPYKVFLKPSLLFMFPYNKLFYMRPLLEAGIIYNPGNFWTAHPKYRLKVKDRTKKRGESK